MAKKLVKLTETDLHRIIKESVNKVLTELDWRTYASAAEKRAQQGKANQSDALINKANDEFSKKHMGNGTNSYQDGNPQEFNNNSARLYGRFKRNGNQVSGEIQDNRGVGITQGTNYHNFNRNGYSQNFQGQRHPEMNQRSQQYTNKLNQMGGEMQNFFNGKSQYQKGKGWE